jgi:hypothetical protein
MEKDVPEVLKRLKASDAEFYTAKVSGMLLAVNTVGPAVQLLV